MFLMSFLQCLGRVRSRKSCFHFALMVRRGTFFLIAITPPRIPTNPRIIGYLMEYMTGNNAIFVAVLSVSWAEI